MEFLLFLKDNYRWLTATALVTFASSFGQTFFISVFAGEIRAEFDLSHGAWGGIYTIGTSLSAVAMIWAGVLTDRFRVRMLGPVFLILLAIACMAMAFVSAKWALIPVIFALRFTGQGMLSQIGTVATVRWFVASRGRALSITMLGLALGNAALPILFVAALATNSWRSLWIVAAGLVLILVPVLFVLLKHERSPKSMSSDLLSVGMNGQQWRRMQLLRHWLFWLLVPTLIGPAAWGTSLFFQQVHLTQVKGWSHLEFVALFPLLTAAMVGMTLVSGWLIDRFSANRVMAYYLIPFSISFLTIALSDTLSGAAVGMILFGASSGMGATLIGAFWAEHCGTQHIGSIKAMVAAVMVFGSAIGPGITGWLIDRGIDFPVQMLWISAYFVVAALLAMVAANKARPLLPAAP